MSNLYKRRIVGNSSRVTFGDPKEFSNRESHKEANTIHTPQMPKKK